MSIQDQTIAISSGFWTKVYAFEVFGQVADIRDEMWIIQILFVFDEILRYVGPFHRVIEFVRNGLLGTVYSQGITKTQKDPFTKYRTNLDEAYHHVVCIKREMRIGIMRRFYGDGAKDINPIVITSDDCMIMSWMYQMYEICIWSIEYQRSCDSVVFFCATDVGWEL